MNMNEWNVFENDNLINTVYYNADKTKDDVYDDLTENCGYPETIAIELVK